MNKNVSASLRLCGLILLFTFSIFAQKIPAPKDVLGFTPGDDRKLASWVQIVGYFQKLDAASDRVKFEEIGKSTMGAPFVYATVSAPENLKNLAKYKEINKKLADPRTFINKSRNLPEDTAKSLIKEGKTIVLITFGIHSTEVGSTLSSMLIAHKLASSDEPQIKKILENTIILLVPSLNPDGVDIVKNWYDKTLGTPFEGTSPPELYHKYVGHDNNRDWYAFTQVETQLTVDKIHNEWHPQIVHDVHQQGERGARFFIPPYEPPVEPNVPKEIVEGYTELGNFIAKDLRGKGFQGITNNTTYDAWTPARAYSHYHGGVRILSETASARLATPVEVKFDELRGGRNFDAKIESENFAPVWKGGAWTLRDITNFMTTASFSLLNHAADNREKWLSRFYAIGKEATRPRKDGELFAYVLETEKNNYGLFLTGVLESAGVEITRSVPFTLNGKKYENGTSIIRLDQPYASFAKAMIEPQIYPNLLDEKGQPIPPYDVTSHTLALFTNTKVDKVFRKFAIPKQSIAESPLDIGDFNLDNLLDKSTNKTNLLYKSHIPSMDEGWTRWIFDEELFSQIFGFNFPPDKQYYRSVFNEEIQKGNLTSVSKTIIFPDQSPNQIMNGYAKGTMPDEYTGGIGKEGVENLRKFVEAGGTLVFLNRASNFAIEQFNLPVKDVTQDLPRKDFYIPGSILRTEIDTTHPIAKGMPKESIAWFENSPVFEIQTDPLALTNNFKIIAKYPKDANKILLSGWALGEENLAGKAALVEFTIGKGKIVLFGFRPQYRGQSLATFPLLFNAISE